MAAFRTSSRGLRGVPVVSDARTEVVGIFSNEADIAA